MAGTIVAVGVVAATALFATGSAMAAGAAATSQRAAAAADAAALAAADTALGFADGDPCTRAAEVAVRTTVALASCTVGGAIATVEVVGRFGPLEVRARARAGPPPP